MGMVNIYPELISWRVNRQGLAPITLRFEYDRRYIGSDNLNQKIPPDHWDPNAKRVLAKNVNACLINGMIENRLNRHRQFALKRQAFDLPLTKEILKKYISTGGKFESFYTYAELVVSNKLLKDGKPYNPDTMRRYRDEIKRLMTYKPELQLSHITLQFLTTYKTWLQQTFKKKDGGDLHKNSIWKALSFIRMVYNQAISEQLILPDGNPFKVFKVGSFQDDESKVKYLELEDVQRLENSLLTEPMETMTKKVGWRFLSMCVSGMRISDAMKLDEFHFNDRGDLEFKPQKTIRNENVATIPITTPRQRRYFERTLQDRFPPTDPKNFRTTFNIHLKILAALSGIRINLTSHVGRHTMGSFIVDAGIETKPAMAMLGVKSERVIKTYLHLKQAKLRREADKLGGVM